MAIKFKFRCAVLVLVVTIGASTRSVVAGPFGVDNLLASVNEFTGSSTAPTYIAEYTPTGTRVQIIANVPRPDGMPGPTDEQARDLVLGPGNAISVFNGTFDPTLARYDLTDMSWLQETFAGWSTVNNGTYGGLAADDRYIYATDMETFGPGDTPQGIVRFDTQGGPTIRFAQDIEPTDLNLGRDGFLYALESFDALRYDPVTLQPMGEVDVGSGDKRSIAIDANGDVYVALWSGEIRRVSSTGVILDSLMVPGASFFDIDIDGSGRLALGTRQGEIVMTDTSLDSFTSFQATDSGFGGVFVTFVPEPSSGLLLLAIACGTVRRQRRSAA